MSGNFGCSSARSRPIDMISVLESAAQRWASSTTAAVLDTGQSVATARSLLVALVAVVVRRANPSRAAGYGSLERLDRAA
jgi:hypothetical protein